MQWVWYLHLGLHWLRAEVRMQAARRRHRRLLRFCYLPHPA